MDRERLIRFIINRIEWHDGPLPTACWRWTGWRDRYAQMRIGLKAPLVHRLTWGLKYGPVPEGLQLDHLCRVRLCVNPDHLEPVTCRENILRGEGVCAANARKTHCPSGHEYTDTNTYNHRGKRQCWTCKRATQRRRYEREARHGENPEGHA